MLKAIRQRVGGGRLEKQNVPPAHNAVPLPLQSPESDQVLQRGRHDDLDVQVTNEQPMASAIETRRGSATEPKHNIWLQAWERLRATKPDLLNSFESIVKDDVSSASTPQERLSAGVAKAKADMLSKQWSVKFKNHRVKVREQVQRIMKIFQYAQDLGSVIVNIDPVHAGLPWAGINVLLTPILNDSKQNETALDGLEEISNLVARYAVIEDVYLKREALNLKADYQENLTDLYTKIFEFQATAACHFDRNTFVRVVRSTLQLEDWSKLLQDIKAKDMACKELMHVFDSRDQKSATTFLQEVLRQQDLTLQTILEQLRSDQEHNNKIVRWLSNVPYKTDHDQVRSNLGARYQDSGRWLLELLDRHFTVDESSVRKFRVVCFPISALIGAARHRYVISLLKRLVKAVSSLLNQLVNRHTDAEIYPGHMALRYCRDR